MTPSGQSNRPRSGAEFLELWERLATGMDAIRATKSLREAVNALETVREIVGPGEAREIADTAILRVRELLDAEVDLEAYGGYDDRRDELLRALRQRPAARAATLADALGWDVTEVTAKLRSLRRDGLADYGLPSYGARFWSAR